MSKKVNLEDIQIKISQIRIRKIIQGKPFEEVNTIALIKVMGSKNNG